MTQPALAVKSSTASHDKRNDKSFHVFHNSYTQSHDCPTTPYTEKHSVRVQVTRDVYWMAEHKQAL